MQCHRKTRYWWPAVNHTGFPTFPCFRVTIAPPHTAPVLSSMILKWILKFCFWVTKAPDINSFRTWVFNLVSRLCIYKLILSHGKLLMKLCLYLGLIHKITWTRLLVSLLSEIIKLPAFETILILCLVYLVWGPPPHLTHPTRVLLITGFV